MTTLAELGIDLRPAVNGLLNGIWTIGDGDSRMVKMEEYVRCLEEERGKIDAFKRELPLCMLILTDVIDALKEEVMHCRGEAGSGRPVLEQFMPIKSKAEEDGGARKPDKDSKDKMNWMSSAQLWSDSSTDDNSHSNNNTGRSKRDEDERSGEADRQSESHDPFAERKYTCGGGGAFRPFKGIPGEARKEEKETAAPLPDLSLLTPEFNGSRDVSRIPEEHRSCGSSSVGKTSLVSPSSNAQLNHLTQQQQQQGPRKARRCWSPELHRRFVNALQQLGGSQFATPKQIRELMKVDGLTNDEVKSHLQKYRLHTRRLAPSSGSLNQPVVVLGGSWVSSSDQCTGAKPSDSQLGSPQGPLQLASATRGISLTGVDSCEDEDGKSESYSWRGNSQRSGEEETE